MPDSVRASEFIVTDENGRDRARLGTTADGVSLKMQGTGEDAPVVELVLAESGDAKLEFRSGGRTIRLLIDEHRAQIKLKNHESPESSCGLTLDGAGAWVSAEASPDIGVRVLSNHGGDGAVVWLSERTREDGEAIVRTRYVRPDPRDDATGGWRSEL